MDSHNTGKYDMRYETLKGSLAVSFLSTMTGIHHPEKVLYMINYKVSRSNEQDKNANALRVLRSVLFCSPSEKNPLNSVAVVNFICSNVKLTPMTEKEYRSALIVLDNITVSDHRKRIIRGLLRVRDRSLTLERQLCQAVFNCVIPVNLGVLNLQPDLWLIEKLRSPLKTEDDIVAYDILMTMRLTAEMIILNRYVPKSGNDNWRPYCESH